MTETYIVKREHGTVADRAWPIAISILADIAGEDDPRIAQLRSIFSEQAK